VNVAGDETDVPYGEDFHDAAAAAQWADAAFRKRPWRATIFEHFVAIVGSAATATPRVLELGSGPGFLAEQVLGRCPSVGLYTLVDFSEAMLEQSRRRLELHTTRTQFVRADFKTAEWPGLVKGPFDFVLSLQAVHELRHKRHAVRLYAQLLSLLSPVAEVVICDHLPEGAHTPRHRVLYMNIDENLAAFAQAGFSNVTVAWSDHHMALFRARVR
jgi:trans-aconitate methyltransferase